MTHITDYPPIPGIWVRRAQDALDVLSTARTVGDVVATLSSARTITEEILGTPASGGAATRRSIRAVGGLVRHRLGPALAAEGLSWAASASGRVSSSTVEAFLEHIQDAPWVHQPLRLVDRYRLHAHLELCRSERERRRTLVRLWEAPGVGVTTRGRAPSVASGSLELWPDDDLTADLELWLQERIGTDGDSASPRVIDVYRAPDDHAQLLAFERLGASQQIEVAKSHLLFDLAPSIVARCLVEHTATVLTNATCPAALRERIRHPYDAATVELALRAGPAHFEAARLRRHLEQLDDRDHDRFLGELLLPYLVARRACGLNTASEFLVGRLSDVDLSDEATARAALGTADSWKWRRIPGDIVDLLIRHRDARHLAWVLDSTDAGILIPELADRLVLNASEAIAAYALRHVPDQDLRPEHARIAVAAGPYWAARCPGIAATHRPSRVVPDVHNSWALADLWDDWALDRPGWSASTDLFEYPGVIEELERTYPEAPGWTVTLPRTAAALVANAEAMRNCTASYESDIRRQRSFIVIVESPAGVRYNVAVHAVRRPTGLMNFVVGQVNSWANGGDAPAWIAPAMQQRLAQATRPVDLDLIEVPMRRSKTRRDRRAAARRRRRDR